MNIDDYKTKLMWPIKPERPAVLAQRIHEVSSDDLGKLVAVKAEYDAAIEAYERAKYAYHTDENTLVVKFREDLAVEHGVEGHTREPKLWALAWEHGHSAGLGEVAVYYGEFAKLIVGTVEAG